MKGENIFYLSDLVHKLFKNKKKKIISLERRNETKQQQKNCLNDTLTKIKPKKNEN